MFYEYDVTAPANTPASYPTTVIALLGAGTLSEFHVQIPRGCDGLVHAYVQDALHHVIPANQDGDMKGDDVIVSAPDQLPIPTDDYSLELCVYNLDDSYAHTVTFRLVVTPAAELAQQQSALSALLYLDKWFSSQLPPAATGGG